MRSPQAQVLLKLAAFAFVLGGFGASAHAQDKREKPETKVRNDQTVPTSSFLTLTHHGYFRLRSDLFFRGDLGTGIGGLANPWDPALEAVGEDSDVIMSTNMRFRWQPELKIGSRLKIRATFDVLDNVVLGSTADYASGRPDVPFTFLSESQLAAEDVVRVKHLWAEWEILHAVVLSVGRMPDHFGLGIASNGGECLDCDYGDSTDRVSALFRLFGFHSLWFFDSPGEGATTQDTVQNFGQASDLDSEDDAIRWGFTIGQMPLDPAAEAERKSELEAGKPVFDWVIRNSFTSQNLTSIPNAACDTSVSAAESFDCRTLAPRNVDLWMPDIWGRMLWRPSFDTSVRLEFEVAGIVGDAEFTQNVTGASSRKDFVGFGGVLQAEVQHRKLTYDLEVGFATGDDVAFGPFGPGFTVPNEAEYQFPQNQRIVNNRTVNWFLFDRDYHVDLLLYREVLGTVTNSIYVKPSITANFIESEEHVFGTEVSLLYAHALEKDSTPGVDNPLGFETDLRIFYEVPNMAIAELEAGILVPFDALNVGSGGRAPGTAFTLQARITMTF